MELEKDLQEENAIGTGKEQVTATTTDSSTQKPDNTDPEFDLGMDVDGKTPLKLKRSQILESRKGGMLEADYTKKNQELSAEREKFKEMGAILDHLKANPDKARRVIAILDEKEQKLEEKIDEIDEILKTLPDDDPYSKILRGLRKQNQDLLKTSQDLQDKVNGYEQRTNEFTEREATKQAETILTQALDNIIKTLKFEDEDDKSDWKKQVLTYIINNPKKYSSEAEMVSDLNNIGKSEFDNLVKRNERITGRYIKSKTQGDIVSHPGGAGGKPLTQKPTKANLQEILQEALEEEDKK